MKTFTVPDGWYVHRSVAHCWVNGRPLCGSTDVTASQDSRRWNGCPVCADCDRLNDGLWHVAGTSQAERHGPAVNPLDQRVTIRASHAALISVLTDLRSEVRHTVTWLEDLAGCLQRGEPSLKDELGSVCMMLRDRAAVLRRELGMAAEPAGAKGGGQ